MASKARATLIRARFRALGGKFPPPAQKPPRRPPEPEPSKAGPLFRLPFLMSSYYGSKPPKWVVRPDGTVKVVLPPRKRRSGESPLVRIAAQFPRGLKRKARNGS